MERRFGELKEIVAGAGYHRLLDAGDARSGAAAEGIVAQEVGDVDETSIVEFESEGEVPDPLDVLLDYILETTDVETAIASDDDVWSIVGGKSVVDFASYLRHTQPPVQVIGTVGSLSMEDVISHEQALGFTRRVITASDSAEWPDASIDGVGCQCLKDGRVFIGPSNAETRPLNLQRLAFTDSRNPSHRCHSLALSADGKFLAASFNSHTESVSALCFSLIDYTLVSGSDDGTVIVWDTRCGHVLLHLVHGEPVGSIAYAPQNALIATGSATNGSMKVWDASSGACLHSFSVDGKLYMLAFSPHSSCLCVDLGAFCILYDIHTYARTATLQHDVEKWLQSSMSHQGDCIVTGSALNIPGPVKIWSTATGEELLTIDHPKKLSRPVAFSPDGAEVVAGCDADTTAVTYD
ncbi:uncharacterized protein PHACADRAFT_208150 [Phanerochaete carnosa HHB-10118-sp]|uniref:Uncharacterized protein n=1 Tax=Phanerochaete carnosa (strain HHB-10118-sp) TaxID=650164 RepID=K5VZH7_PHACS|nr:uncharacterized protein PHACADRAFT_208150 [Phanerochaete carnosa HHB-10118-sp]EKM56983.1 hypothetical protein PHACADRAFT_208150 [Phanerochaete carnosa HHB-10118-sp]